MSSAPFVQLNFCTHLQSNVLLTKNVKLNDLSFIWEDYSFALAIENNNLHAGQH